MIIKPTANSTYPKGGVSCSKDSFVVNGTLVFQIKFCGKSPALRVAAKRYGECDERLLRQLHMTKINNMRTLLFLFFQLTFCSLFGQNEITFEEPLKIVATEKINAEVKKGAILSATGLKYSYNDEFPILTVVAKNIDGSSVSFEPKK